MPGPFTHIYVERRVAKLLKDGVTPEFVRPQDGALDPAQLLDPDGMLLDPAACAAAMDAWPKFAALGAVGPDIFFFLQDYANPAIPCDELMLAMSLLYFLDDQGRLDDPYDGLLLILAEISDTWAKILRFIVKLDQIWKKFLEVWNATIGPILDKAGQVIDDLSGGLFSALGDAFTELKNDIVGLAAEEILTEADIFDWFSLKMRAGLDEQAFVWSDMLHYRRTSKVPQRLLHHARGMSASADPLTQTHGAQLTAFALGWICHLGADTVAHSFVNQQCGGPFRTHWQRHHLVENHIDAFLYQGTGDGTVDPDPFVGSIDSYRSLNQSALYFAVQIPKGIDGLPPDRQQGDLRQPLPAGDDKTSQAERTKLLDTDGALPDWLADMMVKVLVEVYADPAEGGLKELQEEPTPHPRNLMGQPFQDALGDGATLLGKWLEVLGVDNAGMAFSDLRKAVARDTPAGLNVPQGFPLPWEVQATYRFLLSWFKRSYVSTFDMPKPKRPTVFTPPSSDFNFGPPDFSGVSSADNPISEICAAIAAILDWIFKTLEGIAQFLYDVVKMIASAVTWPVRELIYDFVTLPAWQVAENIRIVLAHLGYLMPQSEELWDDGEIRKPSEIDLELITLGHTVNGTFAAALASALDILGNLDHDPALSADTIRNPKSADYPWLPVRDLTNARADKRRDVVEFRRPWAYPDRINESNPERAGNYVENPPTTAGPYPQEALPTALLGITGPASNPLRLQYEEAQCPEETDRLNTEHVGHDPGTPGYGSPEGIPASGTNPLGDPIVFSTYLIGQIANNRNYAVSYNLDADRAYGYLCWDWTRSDATSCNLRHQSYRLPVVPPEGSQAGSPSPPDCPTVGGPDWPVPSPTKFGDAPAKLWQPDTPLQLRYPGRECVDVPGQLSGRVIWKIGDIKFDPAKAQGPVTVEAVTPVHGGGLGQVSVVASGAAGPAVQSGGGMSWLSFTIQGVPFDIPVSVRLSNASSPAFTAFSPGWWVSDYASSQVTLTQQNPAAGGLDVTVSEQAPIG